MIYLVVRLAEKSVKAESKASWAEETEQIWLDPTPHSEEASQIELLEADFDDSRVQWFRSPRIAYVLRAR